MNLIGIDVGSGSVRVALTSFQNSPGYATTAKVLASESKVTTTTSPSHDWYEQSTSEIWSAVTHCVKECLTKSNTRDVHGIAFTATCSLVAVAPKTKTEYEGEKDIIMWMDHRSVKEAAKISKTKDELLNQVGGVCSPEFSLAKLSWLKENARDKFDSCLAFMELPDYLTWKCLVSSELSDEENLKLYRPSTCSVVCKWFYDAKDNEWSGRLMNRIGLESLLNNGCQRIGKSPALPGTFLGCMSEQVKRGMGIDSSCQVAVASSIIDAHAGVLAMLAIHCNSNESTRTSSITDKDIEEIFCSITGTSSCHMISSKTRRELPGIWGPYLNVVLKDFFVHEPGQSATGKLLDHIVSSYKSLDGEMYEGKSTDEIYKALGDEIARRQEKLVKNSLLINPDFHGNRSPLADPSITGGVCGLTLNKPLTLLELYESTIESIIYETKFILDRMARKPKVILVSGGLRKNAAFMQIYADVIGTPVTGMHLPDIDMMLTGATLLARQAALKNDGPTLDQMTGIAFDELNLSTFKPNGHYRDYHDKKYQAFLEFMNCSQKLSKMLRELPLDPLP